MKHLTIFALLFVLLTACGESEPPFTDNGNPGQIRAIVFYDDDRNGKMDADETGAPHRVAVADQVGCTTSTGTPDFIPTDSNGVVIFSDLKPGQYCVAIDNGYGMTTKMNLDVYVSSDLVTTVYFGVVREP
jgi:uncharacterized protein (DUF2141 family)